MLVFSRKQEHTENVSTQICWSNVLKMLPKPTPNAGNGKKEVLIGKCLKFKVLKLQVDHACVVLFPRWSCLLRCDVAGVLPRSILRLQSTTGSRTGHISSLSEFLRRPWSGSELCQMKMKLCWIPMTLTDKPSLQRFSDHLCIKTATIHINNQVSLNFLIFIQDKGQRY